MSCIQPGYKSIKCTLGMVGGFTGGSAGKELPCNARHLGCKRPGFYPWVRKIPWRRKQLPTPVFWPGEVIAADPCTVHGVSKGWTRLSDFHFT